MASAEKSNRRNPYRRMLRRMMWGRWWWLTLPLAVLGCLALHLALSSGANIIIWRVVSPSGFSSQFGAIGFALIMTGLRAPFTYGALLAYVLAWRFRAVLTSPLYRLQFMLIPDSRRSVFQALGLQVLWLGPTVAASIVAFYIIYSYVMRAQVSVAWELSLLQILSGSGLTFGMSADWGDDRVFQVFLVCWAAIFQLKGLAHSLLILTLMLMALLRVRQVVWAVLLAAGIGPLASMLLNAPRYAMAYMGQWIFSPESPWTEFLLALALTGFFLLFYLVVLGLLWRFCFRWLERRQLPLESEEG